ncbi:uncharacterized protein [Eleutherodactylus coqui]|uniref:uncharacterized protein n=1 Tax=Eleutherodactylus coqui TaxID=57060 RepID=UPI0034622AA6
MVCYACCSSFQKVEMKVSRFNLRRKDGLVDFPAFVNKLKSRSKLSFMKRMVDQAEQRQGSNISGTSEGFLAEEAEWLLFQLCQGPFIHLLAQFRKCHMVTSKWCFLGNAENYAKCEADALGNGCIHHNDFKEIVEKTIQTPVTPEQVRSFAVLLGEEGSTFLPFIKFIALIQDRPSTFELKEEVDRLSSLTKVYHRMDSILTNPFQNFFYNGSYHAQTPRKLSEKNAMLYLQSFCIVNWILCLQKDIAASQVLGFSLCDGIFIHCSVLSPMFRI